MKKLLVLLLALAMVLATTGALAEGLYDGDPVTLQMGMWGSTEGYDQVNNKFLEMFPEIDAKVDIECVVEGDGISSSIPSSEGYVDIVSNMGELNEIRLSQHPIFLVLNLTEVNLLTNLLMSMVENTQFSESYRHLIGKIVFQLSDYAKERLGIDKGKIRPVKPEYDNDQYYRDILDQGGGYAEKMKIVRSIRSQNDSNKI